MREQREGKCGNVEMSEDRTRCEKVVRNPAAQRVTGTATVNTETDRKREQENGRDCNQERGESCKRNICRVRYPDANRMLRAAPAPLTEKQLKLS